jgi:hypothetical protein
MINPRRKALIYGVAALVAVWVVALAGYLVAQSRRMTADKVRAYLRHVDLDRLTGEARAQALRDLAAKLNALPYEERRMARLDREWQRWFVAMDDQEKGQFIEATLPTGFKQMLGAFEQLPPERRRKTVDDALRRLKEAREQVASGEVRPEDWGTNAPPDWGTNAPPVITEELRQKVITTGLKSFYSQSSAQTKAEVAPLLEELQRMMEGGAFLRGMH